MAVALEKLEDQLTCSICLDTYSNPKQLQCHHVYCQECLAKLVLQDQHGQHSLPCPSCRQVTPVSEGGVAELQAAFRVNQLLEIVEKNKKTAVTTTSLEKVETSLVPNKSIPVYCLKHGEKEVELYCETCGKTICWKCIKKGEEHHTHNYEELSEAFERYKGELVSSLEPMEKQLTIVRNALAQFDARCDEISDQEAAIETEINDTIAQFHETLDIRKNELVKQLHKLTQVGLKHRET